MAWCTRLTATICMFMGLAPLAAAAEAWAPEEFTVVSGPASPRVALAVRRDGPRLSLAVEAAVLPGGEPSVKLGVAAGKTVTEIADEMSLSAKTISTYRTRVLEKLGVKNSAKIVQYALRNGLVI